MIMYNVFMKPVDYLILIIIALVLVLAVRSLRGNRKKGKASCGAVSCENCPSICGFYKASEAIRNRNSRN